VWLGQWVGVGGGSATRVSLDARGQCDWDAHVGEVEKGGGGGGGGGGSGGDEQTGIGIETVLPATDRELPDSYRTLGVSWQEQV